MVDFDGGVGYVGGGEEEEDPSGRASAAVGASYVDDAFVDGAFAVGGVLAGAYAEDASWVDHGGAERAAVGVIGVEMVSLAAASAGTVAVRAESA
jgi:hypothetical protein